LAAFPHAVISTTMVHSPSAPAPIRGHLPVPVVSAEQARELLSASVHGSRSTPI